jgi:hypothetical protein
MHYFSRGADWDTLLTCLSRTLAGPCATRSKRFTAIASAGTLSATPVLASDSGLTGFQPR